MGTLLIFCFSKLTEPSSFTPVNFLFVLIPLLICSPLASAGQSSAFQNPDPHWGAQFFREKRFSFDHSTGCISCHAPEFAFADGRRKSPVPRRAEDSVSTTLRNSPGLLDAQILPAQHWDGEFVDPTELVMRGLTGRNFGWLPHEADVAQERVFQVVTRSKSYAAWIQKQPKRDRAALLKNVSSDISSYLKTLRMKRDPKGDFSGSAYDRFLQLNHLPKSPHANESRLSYINRLSSAIFTLESPQWISSWQPPFSSWVSHAWPQHLRPLTCELAAWPCTFHKQFVSRTHEYHKGFQR